MRPGESELVFRAIKFLFHLKGILEFAVQNPSEKDSAPTRIGLGAGIHFGRVAGRSLIEQDGHSVINQIEGYAINRAKRIESSSRAGRYSRVFLSKEPAMLLEDQPVILLRLTVSMKGIEESAEVYEVARLRAYPKISVLVRLQQDFSRWHTARFFSPCLSD